MVDRFGEKLRKLREQAGLTQIVLTQRLGYKNQGYISRIESGLKKPTVELALKVAHLFHVTTDVLLRDDLELDEISNGCDNHRAA